MWGGMPLAPLVVLLSVAACAGVLPCSGDATRSNQPGSAGATGPLSPPVASDAQRSRDVQKPLTYEDVLFGTDGTGHAADATACPLDVSLAWSAEASAPLYATPALSPLRLNGRKQAVAAAYVQDVELFEHDGHKPMGWPLSLHRAVFHASPLLWDVDGLGGEGDGRDDIVLCTRDGRVIFVHLDEQANYQQEFTLTVPRMAVRTDWFDGLAQPGVDAYVELSEFEDVAVFDDAAVQGSRGADGANADPVFREERRSVQGGRSDGFWPQPAVETSPGRGAGSPGQSGDDDADGTIELTADGQSIFVDAHILATPYIGDVNGDGGDELVIPVSYYFDSEDYPDTVEVGSGVSVDPTKYAACAVLCYDLRFQAWNWRVHLDLSTATGALVAIAEASPTVADLEGDGTMEVVVPTTLGFVHVVDANGASRAGWPVELAPIESQAVVEDVAEDEGLEIIVAQRSGAVTVLRGDGSTIWEKRTTGDSTGGPVVGDIDGDQSLDVVVATVDGALWALRGSDGTDLAHFPVRMAGRAMAPVTLLRLGQKVRGAHLLSPCHDGHLYVVDGSTGCVNKVDIGEHSYAAVLADDLSEDNRLELLVSTMNGNLVALATDTPYHPLNSLPAHGNGGGGLLFRMDYHGAYFAAQSHKFHGVVGDHIDMAFTIVDNRPGASNRKRAYDVRIAAGRLEVFREQFAQPGTYNARIQLPSPQQMSLRLTMTNEHGQRFTDVASVAFNTRFYVVLQWAVALPLLLSGALLLCISHPT